MESTPKGRPNAWISFLDLRLLCGEGEDVWTRPFRQVHSFPHRRIFLPPPDPIRNLLAEHLTTSKPAETAKANDVKGDYNMEFRTLPSPQTLMMRMWLLRHRLPRRFTSDTVQGCWGYANYAYRAIDNGCDCDCGNAPPARTHRSGHSLSQRPIVLRG